jgi:hypothetical protein
MRERGEEEREMEDGAYMEREFYINMECIWSVLELNIEYPGFQA